MNGQFVSNLRHFPFTPFDWLRTGFDKLRANGRLDQSFPNVAERAYTNQHNIGWRLEFWSNRQHDQSPISVAFVKIKDFLGSYKARSSPACAR